MFQTHLTPPQSLTPFAAPFAAPDDALKPEHLLMLAKTKARWVARHAWVVGQPLRRG